MYKEAILDAVSIHELPSKWHSDILKEAKNATKKKKASKFEDSLLLRLVHDVRTYFQKNNSQFIPSF